MAGPLRRLMLLLPLAAALCACCPGGKVRLSLGGEHFCAEIADTPRKMQIGLMFRRELPADEGMLFIFSNSRPRNFWMKNTLIPLDILYFDDKRRLVSWVRALPCDHDPCPAYPSTGSAQFVLELNSGTATRIGVSPGDVLGIPRAVRPNGP